MTEEHLTVAHLIDVIQALRKNEVPEPERLFLHHSQFDNPELMAGLRRMYPNAEFLTIRPLPTT